MLKPCLAVITGGDSPEAPGSYTTAQHVFSQLDPANYQRCLIELVGGRWRLIRADGLSSEQIEQAEFDLSVCAFSIPGSAQKMRFDYALVAIHGYPGETGELQGYLECVGVPYTGSRVLASSLGMNKHLCKSVLASALSLNVPWHHELRESNQNSIAHVEREFDYPMMVKPNSGGSGMGVAKVFNRDALKNAIADIEALGQQVFIEQCIPGREVTVGVVRRGGRAVALPVAEVFREPESSDSASEGSTVHFTSRQNAKLVVPAALQSDICDALAKLATDIGGVIGCCGCYRVDFIISDDGRLFFLEVNTVPGMAEASVLTRQIEAAGMQLSDVLDEMLVATKISA